MTKYSRELGTISLDILCLLKVNCTNVPLKKEHEHCTDNQHGLACQLFAKMDPFIQGRNHTTLSAIQIATIIFRCNFRGRMYMCVFIIVFNVVVCAVTNVLDSQLFNIWNMHAAMFIVFSFRSWSTIWVEFVRLIESHYLNVSQIPRNESTNNTS